MVDTPIETSARFLTFSAYAELRPLVLSTIKLSDSLRNQQPAHNDLLIELRKQSINSLLYLVDGYNKYHCDDKANCMAMQEVLLRKFNVFLSFFPIYHLFRIHNQNK